MSNQHDPRFAKETLQGQQHQIHCSQTTKESATPNVGKWRWQSSSQKWSGSFHSQDWLADVPKLSHSFREICYGTAALSQKRRTAIQVIFTQSSVSMTTTPEYLPVSGFNVPSLHLSQSLRIHPFQVSQKTNCNNPSNVKSYLTCLRPLNNCAGSRQKHEKQTHNKSFLFRFKSHKTVSTSYTVQAVLQWLTTCFQSNAITTAVRKPWILPGASENQNQHSQTVKQSSLWPFLLTVCCQLTTSTPSSPCLQCHDGSYFSLSLSTPVPKLPGKTKLLQASVSRSPVQNPVKPHCSCTLPNLRCPTTHVLFPDYTKFSHLTHAAIQFSHEPRSLTKQNLTLQVPIPQFLFLTTTSRHDARLSSTTHCALRASRINYNLTNLSRCNSFSYYFSNFLSTLSSDSPGSLCQKPPSFSSDSPGSLCQSHPQHFLQWLPQALFAKVTKLFTKTNLTCNATRSFSPIFLTLTTTVRNSIAYIYHISHTTLGVTGISTLQCPVVSA